MNETPFGEPGPDDASAWGVVVDEGRGSLPYSLIHGEPLVACAAWALGQAGVTPIDAGIPWSSVRRGGEPVVLHDSLCPMTPVDLIVECLRRALAEDAVVVATRPVTDTVKAVSDGLVGDTVDLEDLRAMASPVVLPASVVAALRDGPGADLVGLVAELARSHRVVLVEAPVSARRVSSYEDLAVLEALTTS